MKKLMLILTLLFIIFISYGTFAQDINVHNAIGKKQSEVIKKYGNPVHQDNSNPSMKCMFYKGSTYTLTFVSDENGIYQAEANASYESLEKANLVIAAFLTDSRNNEYTIDSVTVTDYNLQKKGIKVDLQLAENKLSKKYDVRVKAVRTSEWNL